MSISAAVMIGVLSVSTVAFLVHSTKRVQHNKEKCAEKMKQIKKEVIEETQQKTKNQIIRHQYPNGLVHVGIASGLISLDPLSSKPDEYNGPIKVRIYHPELADSPQVIRFYKRKVGEEFAKNLAESWEAEYKNNLWKYSREG